MSPTVLATHSQSHVEDSRVGLPPTAFEMFEASAKAAAARSVHQPEDRAHDWIEGAEDAMAQLPRALHPAARMIDSPKNKKVSQSKASKLRQALQILTSRDRVTDDDVLSFPWHHITEDEAEAFRRAVYLKYTNQCSRNDLVCMVRAMVRGACRRSLISAARRELLLDKLYTRTPARSAKGRLLKDDEVSRLLEACSSTGTAIARSRNVAIVALLRTSGMRSCELVSLELKDWDREHDTLTLRDTKNGSTHTVFLHPEAKPYLSAWVRGRGDRDGALFTNLNAVEPVGISTFSLRYMVRTRAEAAGIRKFGIHDFRRTFATELLRTHDHSLVSKLLNHRKLSSTLIYDLAEDDLQRAAVAGIALPSVGGTRDGICGTDLDLGDEDEGATK